jgi:hypothetical protein
LEEFNYTFTYHPEKDNAIADMLSRYPMVQVSTTQYEEVTTIEPTFFPATFDKIHESQQSLTNLSKKLASPHYKTIHCNDLPIIYRKTKIVLDPTLLQEIIGWYHTNLNHLGQD